MRKISMFAPIVAVLVAAGVLFDAATSSLACVGVPAAVAASQPEATAERANAAATENWVETGNPDQGNETKKKSKDKPDKPTNH